MIARHFPTGAIFAAALLAAPSFLCAAPPNDDFANRQSLPASTSISVPGTTVDATQEAFEKVNGSNSPAGSAINEKETVWYDWVPPVSGTVHATFTRGTSQGQTYLLVFQGGAIPTLSELVAQGYLPGNVSEGAPPAADFHVAAAQEYTLSLGNTSYPGNFTLSLTLTPGASFFTGESSLGSGVYYLTFPSSNYFGYYSYLADPAYIYHFDLGYEYVFDAADGKSGVYLYDFTSKTFFYTSPTFPFPYLYDFSLNTVLYYYPDPSNAGHYNTNGVRYFYDFNTGTIIFK